MPPRPARALLRPAAAALEGDLRASYEHCLRAGQEQPSLWEASNGDELPPYAQWLGEDSRVTKGWYVRLCDPSLPEATEFQEVDVDHATEAALGEGPD